MKRIIVVSSQDCTDYTNSFSFISSNDEHSDTQLKGRAMSIYKELKRFDTPYLSRGSVLLFKVDNVYNEETDFTNIDTYKLIDEQ